MVDDRRFLLREKSNNRRRLLAVTLQADAIKDPGPFSLLQPISIYNTSRRDKYRGIYIRNAQTYQTISSHEGKLRHTNTKIKYAGIESQKKESKQIKRCSDPMDKSKVFRTSMSK